MFSQRAKLAGHHIADVLNHVVLSERRPDFIPEQFWMLDAALCDCVTYNWQRDLVIGMPLGWMRKVHLIRRIFFEQRRQLCGYAGNIIAHCPIRAAEEVNGSDAKD